MSKEQRRHLSSEQKLAILREHLVERKPVSDICERHGLAPSLCYDWQKPLFEHGTAAFARPSRTSSREQQLAARRVAVQPPFAAVDSVRRFTRRQVHAGATHPRNSKKKGSTLDRHAEFLWEAHHGEVVGRDRPPRARDAAAGGAPDRP